MRTSMRAALLSLLSLVLVTTSLGAARTASADEEQGSGAPGVLEFVGKNLLMTANGTFHRWRFTRVEVDREHPERSVVEVEVDVASLDTGIERRDDHLRTPDFFEVETWPTASVRITQATPDGRSDAGNPRYRADFQVRIRDVEKTLPGSFELVEASPPRVEGELVLDRTDFGVGEPHRWWNPASPEDDIPIRFSVTLPAEGAPAQDVSAPGPGS